MTCIFHDLHFLISDTDLRRFIKFILTGSCLVGSQGNILSLNESVFSLQLVKK